MRRRTGASGTVDGRGCVGCSGRQQLNLGASVHQRAGRHGQLDVHGRDQLHRPERHSAAIVINKAVASGRRGTGYSRRLRRGSAHGASWHGDAAWMALVRRWAARPEPGARASPTYPGGTASWTFTGGTNYTDQSGTAAIVIARRGSTTTNNGVPSSAVYTGSAQGISGTTVSGAGGLATVATSTVHYDCSCTSVPRATMSCLEVRQRTPAGYRVVSVRR